jgi:hypothetical protein
MSRILVRTAIGTVAGAVLGALPGIVASYVPLLMVGFGHSTLLVYLGLLIGAAAGSVVGTMCAALESLQKVGAATTSAPARPSR